MVKDQVRTDKRMSALRSEMNKDQVRTDKRISALRSEMDKDQVRTDKRLDDRISSLRSEFTRISTIAAITFLIIAATIFSLAMIDALG